MNDFYNNDGFYSHSKDDIVQDEINKGTFGEDYNKGFYPRPKRKRKKKKYSLGIVIISVVLAAVVGAASGIYVTNNLKSTGTKTILGKRSNVSINVDETVESVVEAVAEKASPSVVGIRTTSAIQSFFGGTSESSGEGSGVVYSTDGYIITNYHVISGAANQGSKIEVFLDSTLSDAYKATVVGYNISADIAVLKINVNGLTPVELGNSDELKVGQYAITIGNPGGLEFMKSVTYGVISGLNRVVSTDSNVELIQTDAAINPGNSGGALLNTSGQLIGINSSKIVSEEFEGMGFAIPVNTVKKLCDNIIAKQNSPEPYIGVTISEKYTASVLEYYGYPAGAVVLMVDSDSPAYKAGISKGDIITEFNGKSITNYNKLDEYLSDCNPGDTVNVKIYRSGRIYTADITVGSNSAQ